MSWEIFHEMILCLMTIACDGSRNGGICRYYQLFNLQIFPPHFTVKQQCQLVHLASLYTGIDRQGNVWARETELAPEASHKARQHSRLFFIQRVQPWIAGRCRRKLKHSDELLLLWSRLCELEVVMSVMRMAMKLSGALESGGGGRVLRSHSTNSQPSAKVVNSKISFKSKKIVKGAAEKSKIGESPSREGNRSAKMQVDPGILVSGNSVDAGLGKKVPGIKRQRALKSVVVEIQEKDAAVAAGLAGDAGAILEKVTVSSVKTSWSTNLSSADAIAVARKHLTEADAKLGSLIGRHEQAPKFEQCVSCFTALARSIVYQQLATKAASAIYGRLVGLCGVCSSSPVPFVFSPVPVGTERFLFFIVFWHSPSLT